MASNTTSDESNKVAPSSMIDYAATNTGIATDGLNTADGLLFSELSYLRINTDALQSVGGPDISLATGNGQGITIAQLYKYYEDNPNAGIFETRNINHQKDMDMLNAMAHSDRFKDMEISNYCVDPVKAGKPEGFQSIGAGSEVEQFGAMTIKYDTPNGPHNFIAYRGTNGTYEGWSEDFEMISNSTTQAQLDSSTYLNMVASQLPPNEKIELGGHSKGGNDAEYAFLYCDRDVADRVCGIYGYDSPGISSDTMRGTERYDEYLRLSRGKHICPQDSYVGQLLRENGSSTFVHSVESGLGEHDPFSWNIDKYGGFTPDSQSTMSRAIDDILDAAVPTLSPEERQQVFKVADSIIKNIAYPENGERDIKQVLRDIGNNPAVLSVVAKMLIATGVVGGMNAAADYIRRKTGIPITSEDISDFIDMSADTVEEYCNDFREMWETGMDTLKEGWETVKETASGIGEAAVNTWNDITEGAGNLIDSGMDFLSSHNPFSKKSSGPSGHSSSSHGGGGHHRSGGGSGSGGGILSGVMNKLREDFNVLRHGADDLLGYDIILDEEAFAKAASDFEDLADQIKQLRKDIEEQLEMLQHGFDTPAGHKFIDSCRNNLLRPLEEQQIVVEHISETLHKCINEYQSVFNEYSELTALIASD
ncbi:MAG: DUF2974 domain-containing protein [Ruminococcus sp.]|nr:DUF2974 domain-containing protein [Ruminococcus sp.]